MKEFVESNFNIITPDVLLDSEKLTKNEIFN